MRSKGPAGPAGRINLANLALGLAVQVLIPAKRCCHSARSSSVIDR
jgi:hypothetical protein